MTLSLSAFMSATRPGLDLGRAVTTALRIAAKPTAITVDRDGSDLAAQTVRLESFGGERIGVSIAGIEHRIDALVLGYRNHATIDDTDLLPGDRFTANGIAYEILALAPEIPNRLIAYATVRT